MCHISGMPRGAGAPAQADDDFRVLVDAADRTGAAAQMRALRAAGYAGPFSFETTVPGLLDGDAGEAALAGCIAWLRAQVEG